MKKTSKYQNVTNSLIEDIKKGTYKTGTALPSENELINIFGVSRITIRRAIDELYRNGYIDKRQGKKSYIRDTKKTQEISTISSYTEEILRLGMTPSRKVISAILRLPTTEEQEQLGLLKSEPVFHLERVIYADDDPLCYTTTSVPYSIFQDIENIDFKDNSLYKIIEDDYNIKIDFAQIKLRSILADKRVTSLLKIDTYTPLLQTTALTFGFVNGRSIPIEFFKTYYITDLIEYTLLQSRT